MSRPLVPSTETPIPDLLRDYPSTRHVLDRYGLHGCGGANGPVESVGFFARMHGVDPIALINDLRHAIAGGSDQQQATPEPPDPADTIYRRYFTAGMAVILSAGAVWGAYLLWRISMAGSFTSISVHHINAHGHAQIFGWVGLFIMGFGYQAFPRFWRTTLAAPRLAIANFIAMLVGLIACTSTMPFPEQVGMASIALAGGVITTAAAAVFAAQIAITFHRSQARLEEWSAFVLTALVWFIIQSAYATWHTWNLMTAVTHEELLWYLATYQAPLRDLQIHGLALFMILGVSMRMVPALLGTQPTPAGVGWHALALLALAVVLESVLFIAYRWSGNHRLAAWLILPWVMLAVGVVLVAWPWRLWRRPSTQDRSAKFIRMAYLWLAISLVMLLLLPAHHLISGLPFSHAYYGAIRHAITVGFISLMIMGMAAKVVPTLNGVDPRTLPALWGPFILVNVGCLLRVSLQSLTDWHDGVFTLVGVSGVLEVSGLAWWSMHLAGIMWRGRQHEQQRVTPSSQSKPPMRLAAYHCVADIVRWYPNTIDVLVSLGFAPIRSRVLRATLARNVTLAQAATMSGVPLAALLDTLNRAIGAPSENEASLGNCSDDCQQCVCSTEPPPAASPT